MNKIKNKAKVKKVINAERFFCYETCGIFSMCFNKDKKYIAKITGKIIKNNLETSQIIKKHLELEFLKKLLLKQEDLNLFPYQFKYLNLGNMSSTKIFLDKLHLQEFQRKICPEDLKDGIYKR